MATGTAMLSSMRRPLALEANSSSLLRNSWISFRKFSLSAYLPCRSVAPGYSQSRSKPSNCVCLSISSSTLFTKARRPSPVDTMSEYFWPPSPQPPTESISLDLGDNSRNRKKSW